MHPCFPWELSVELHPLQGDRVHLAWEEMQIRAEFAFLGSPGAAMTQLETGIPVLSALQNLLPTLHSHCWPVATPDQSLLHFNVCFSLHPGLVQSLAGGLETALGSPRNGEVGLSHADKLRAAKHRQGLYLIADGSFTQECGLGFLQFVPGNILYWMSHSCAGNYASWFRKFQR